MSYSVKLMTTTVLVAAAAFVGAARAQDANTLADAGSDGNWLTYHGSYKSWHHSPLKQINSQNVKNLKVAWIEQVGRSTRGVQSMPLAKDGVLYFSASYSKVFALKGDTGEL
jgi:alcohol dehydrogenase (cytochrome c)